MKKTVGNLMEPLLTYFFLMDAICREYLDEEVRGNIFREMTKVFCIPNAKEAEEVFRVAEQEPFKSISDSTAYERLCRLIEFAGKNGQSMDITPVDRMVLGRKSEAMRIKKKLFNGVKNLTVDMIRDTLSNTAMNGDVDAMVTLAYMEYHGICVCKDRANALKRLRLCAKWNNLFGNLMGIAYDTEGRDGYYNTLHTILRSADQKEMFAYICRQKSYNGTVIKNPVALMIEKAFGMGIVKRDTYDRNFAKIAFSELISVGDKEKLLLSKKNEAISALMDIPFDAGRSRKFSFNRGKARQLPLPREQELNNVFCGIYPVTNNIPENYRTLLVAGEDEYVTEMYANALKAGFGEGNKVIELDGGTLTKADFVGGKENFILRGLSETKQTHTVFLVKNCDEMEDAELDELIKLLDYENRRRFRLLEPTVFIDLSDVLIVLFASRVNERVKKLAAECDVLWTEQINREEKRLVIDTLFKSRSLSYGIAKAELEAAGREYLEPLRTGQISLLLDGALKRAAFHQETVVTEQLLKEVSSQQSMKKSKREFGYLGGGANEEY